MIREADPRFKNLERKIGIFITLAIAGIAVALLMFGLQRDIFTKKYRLNFTADRGTGFTKGMPVKLSGFRVGRVIAIALNDQAMVDITIEIDRKYSRWIRDNSTVRLVKEGLVGDNIIDVSVGSLDQPELKDREMIVFIKNKGLDEMADEIAAAVKPVLLEVRDIISYINNPEGDLKKSVRHLELLTRNLEGTRRNADLVLTTANGKITSVAEHASQTLDTANQNIQSISPALAKLNTAMERIDGKLPGILQKTDDTLANISRISAETRSLSEKTFPRVPVLASQTEDLLLSSDKLINSIQNIWLFRGTSQQQQGQLFIRGDSYE